MLRVVEASSVLLVRNAVQVLMVQRSRKASFQPGVWVFPGGTRDPADPDLRITAIRELFEETGVLLADGPNDTMHRDWVHGDARVFGEFYRDAMVDSLKLVSRWVTPTGIPSRKKYDTYFYVIDLPNPLQYEISLDSAGESDDIVWIEPETALERYRKGEFDLSPPTYYLLKQFGNWEDRPFTIHPQIQSLNPFCSILPGDSCFNLDDKDCLTPVEDHQGLLLKHNGVHRITVQDGLWHIHQGISSNL